MRKYTSNILINSEIRFLFTFFFCAYFLSCESPTNEDKFNYGTKSDSALHYFNLGWQQILDNGQWTLSEKSFRKAVEFDSTFLLGKSLVGRISSDLDERLKLFQELESQKNGTTKYERLLLDSYLLSINAMNARDQKLESSSEDRVKRRSVSETNFRKFIHKYPEETYIKAEYIEVLHAIYGAQPALDSLRNLVTKSQEDIPFFVSYSSSLEAELGNFDEALLLANQAQEVMDDPTFPEQYVLLANIYLQMDNLDLAKQYIEKAVSLDSKHLIAQGLKGRIDKKLNTDTE